ncbi:bifunctional diaminohydroxyphosphoribosylaminopyrimidine deaminase/5-amino-6-(5-phosphoribosylamino)uracil reductase RibD [Inhella sp. 4Y17]|uniref:Riboflavin biosynthesis protein RibD n=2 Tax=Inhella gelatinilytica TaxID=2795030 RepID=A0A931IVL6_9BURK|nr:bifunctional diaminohydroxyphosphoribosylaminopyrimidine deaminase/5-amino-6-(5-phosphoribosylamino)uracil reductase RibD [Inhella gelatinilytica]
MQAALQLAHHAIGLSDPNPRVGCVIVDSAGRLLGQGHTQAAGGPHAEVMALQDAEARGEDVRAATAYVTLEPCAHHGRTPPCCDALVRAGLQRVVVALEDPNPLVAGQGLARLRAAGIDVEVGPCAAEAAELNIGFLTRMRTGRPFVRLKWAASLDGRTAHPDGHSQWITGPAAREDTQRWRRRASALLTGIGTARADNPRLNVRLPIAKQPLRVLLDARLDLSPDANLLHAPGALRVFHGLEADAQRAQSLRDAGAQLESMALDAQGRLPVMPVLAQLGALGMNEVHVEAGARLNGSFFEANAIDEVLLYVAPRILGAGLPCLETLRPSPLDDAGRWHWMDVHPVGDDLRLRLRPRR